MSDYLTVWRMQVDDENVESLIRDQPKAVAFSKSISPELLSGELVDLGDGQWLHVLRWSNEEGLPKLTARLAANPEEAARAELLDLHTSGDELIGKGLVAAQA